MTIEGGKGERLIFCRHDMYSIGLLRRQGYRDVRPVHISYCSVKCHCHCDAVLLLETFLEVKK